MADVWSFQLYLLSSMRAKEQTEAARRTLGASEKDLAHAREQALAGGVQNAGHRIDLYVRLLGQPFEAAEHASSDRYRVKSLRFRLPLWDALDWVVYGSAEGIAGQPRFERPLNDVNPPTDNFEVWQTVERDLPGGGWQWEIGDEWYPMKDFIGRNEGGRRIALCFDFGLLQKVKVLDDPRNG
jgi:hypothetical protein